MLHSAVGRNAEQILSRCRAAHRQIENAVPSTEQCALVVLLPIGRPNTGFSLEKWIAVVRSFTAAAPLVFAPAGAVAAGTVVLAAERLVLTPAALTGVAAALTLSQPHSLQPLAQPEVYTPSCAHTAGTANPRSIHRATRSGSVLLISQPSNPSLSAYFKGDVADHMYGPHWHG